MTQNRIAASTCSLLVCLALAAVPTVYSTSPELLHKEPMLLQARPPRRKRGGRLTVGAEGRRMTRSLEAQPQPEADGMQNVMNRVCVGGDSKLWKHLMFGQVIGW